MFEFTGAVDDRADTNTIDHGPQRRTLFTRLRATEERVAETVRSLL